MSELIESGARDTVSYPPLRPPQGGNKKGRPPKKGLGRVDSKNENKPKHKALLVVAPRLRYQKAWDIQNDLHEHRKQDRIPDVLILTDHPPVYTLGKNARLQNLMSSEMMNNFLSERKDILVTITTFNIQARYDDYKLAFYKTCTREYTEKWINEIKGLRKWIKELLSKS